MKKKQIKTKLLGTFYGRKLYVESVNGLDDNLISNAFYDMLDLKNRIKRLPWWKRLFNKF